MSLTITKILVCTLTVVGFPWCTSAWAQSQHERNVPQLTLNADADCYLDIGATVTVNVDMTDATVPVVGGQFFLSYDASALQFVSIEVAPGGPFSVTVYECSPGMALPLPQCAPTDGLIDYAVGVPNGDPGSDDDNTLAVITFTTLADACGIEGLVSFRAHDPPTRLSDEYGGEIVPQLHDLAVTTIDGTPPTVNCPPDIAVICGDSTEPAQTGYAGATDNCDDAPEITYDDDTSVIDCIEPTIITRTWTATDYCGHSSSCAQIITVTLIAPPDPEPGPECSDVADCVDAYAGADCVAGVCYVPKNRYLSIDPTTNDAHVAYLLEVTLATVYPTAEGRTWWLGEPACYDYPNGEIVLPKPVSCDGADRFGWVSTFSRCTGGADHGLPCTGTCEFPGVCVPLIDPVIRRWSEVPVHVTGCAVVPVVTYEIRASHDGSTLFSDALEINTIHLPAVPQYWGDLTAGPEEVFPHSGNWLPPDRTMNMTDVQAAIRAFENVSVDTGSAPRIWVDIEIDQVINLADVQFVVMAFEGVHYAEIGPFALIGHHPADCP